MSLFGSLMGDFEDDPFFRSHMMSMQRMNNLMMNSMNSMNTMNSMIADPFGMMEAPALTNAPHQQGRMPGMQMVPFGYPLIPSFGNVGRLFGDMGNMPQNPNCHQSFTSSSIMTMTSGPDGRPQVYQETMSTKTAPGGVKETKRTVSDSRTGVRKLAIGHHIGERAHILAREHNMRNGDQEEHQEFINLEEEEAEDFNREWETKTKRSVGAIAAPSYRSHNPYNRSHQENRQLALPSTVPSKQSKNHTRPIASRRRAIRPALSSTSNNTISTSRSAESTSTSTHSNSNAAAASATESPENLSSQTTSRKRERTPDSEEEVSSKRLSTSPKTSGNDRAGARD